MMNYVKLGNIVDATQTQEFQQNLNKLKFERKTFIGQFRVAFVQKCYKLLKNLNNI